MTEKNYNPKQKENKAMKKQTTKIVNVPIKKIQETKAVKTKEINKINTPSKEIINLKTNEEIKKIDEKAKIKSNEKKKEAKKKQIKKIEVVVNGKSIPISTKYARAICKFVKYKKIKTAIKDLQEVAVHRKAVPMKGEIPHRKGKIMSGRFPKKASEHFIVLLKSLLGNANNHDVEEPIITEAIANLASRPIGRFGKVKRKRTHITIKATEKKLIKNKRGKK